MDAVKFIEESRRMYKVTGKHSSTLAEWVPAEAIVKEVEEWVASHPRKTRQSVFLEQWPEAEISFTDGCLTLDPCKFYKKMRKECVGKLCADCRREFWMQEVK